MLLQIPTVISSMLVLIASWLPRSTWTRTRTQSCSRSTTGEKLTALASVTRPNLLALIDVGHFVMTCSSPQCSILQFQGTLTVQAYDANLTVLWYIARKEDARLSDRRAASVPAAGTCYDSIHRIYHQNLSMTTDTSLFHFGSSFALFSLRPNRTWSNPSLPALAQFLVF